MRTGYQDLLRLGSLLEAELDGRHEHHAEIARLAQELSQKYPEISGTLTRMMERQSLYPR